MLSSCTKEFYINDTPMEKVLGSRGEIDLGKTQDGDVISAYYKATFYGAGYNGYDRDHVRYIAEGTKTNHKVQFDCVVNDDGSITLLGDLIVIGFLDGECDWCTCMDNIWDAPPTWSLLVASALCPECVVGLVVGSAFGCGLSALANG